MKEKWKLKMNDILEYNGYFAEVNFSANDKVFFGKLIDINDLVSFEGDSVKKLKALLNYYC